MALQDLAAMVMAQIELQHAFGHVDSLSGLPNRNQPVEDLQDMATDQPGRRKFAVLVDLIDAAQLSAVLRVIGPSYIDDLVHAATRLLRQALGPRQKLYQVGVMHYATLLDDMDDAALAATTAALLAQVAQITPINGVLAASGAAVGVAPYRLGKSSRATSCRPRIAPCRTPARPIPRSGAIPRCLTRRTGAGSSCWPTCPRRWSPPIS